MRIGAGGASTIGTDLTLLVDGNLVLNGGSAADNGAGIGSSSGGIPAPNTIRIDVGGSVILNGGTGASTGARIGSSAQNGQPAATCRSKPAEASSSTARCQRHGDPNAR